MFINLGATFSECFAKSYKKRGCPNAFTVIIIVLLATTPRSEMHSASYVFGSQGFVNSTGGWNNGIAFLFGLLSVQWTVRVLPDL